MVQTPTPTGLRAIRLQAALSQEALARKVGCSTATIRVVERGARVSAEMQARIAAALGCDMGDLYAAEATA